MSLDASSSLRHDLTLFGQCFTNVREKYIDMLFNVMSLRDITAVSFSWKNSTYLARCNIIHKVNSVKTWYYDKIKSSWKLVITFFFCHFWKIWIWFWVCPMLPLFLPKQGTWKAIFKSLTNFFFRTTEL